MKFEYIKICSFLWPISLWQRRVHISQQMMSYIDFSFFIIYIFSNFYFLGAQGPPKIQIYVWFAFFLFLGPLGRLRGPRAPKNRILSNFPQARALGGAQGPPYMGPQGPPYMGAKGPPFPEKNSRPSANFFCAQGPWPPRPPPLNTRADRNPGPPFRRGALGPIFGDPGALLFRGFRGGFAPPGK